MSDAKKWVTLDTNRSPRFYCPTCALAVYWPQATRGDMSRRKVRVCPYPTCPWCGEKMDGADNDTD